MSNDLAEQIKGGTESAAAVAMRLMLRMGDVRTKWNMAQIIALAHIFADKITLPGLEELHTAMDVIEKEAKP